MLRFRQPLWLLAACAATLVGLGQAAPGAAVSARLALSQEFYYEGDPLPIQLSISNRTAEKIDNPLRSPLFNGFVVRTGGEEIERSGRSDTEAPAHPDKLSPDGFYGATVDLTQLYPELTKSGRYEIYWSADQVISEMLIVTILPRFDPAKRYAAEIVTSEGSFVLDLYVEHSPIAVKSFFDLANAGFYDGLLISEVHSDSFIVGGEPTSGDNPKQPIEFPAEKSRLPLVSGTVVMRPARAAPPSNGASFAILLRPQPAWAGQVTVLGQVTSGLDVVQTLSRRPSTMKNSAPQFKPLTDIKIRSVTVTERATAEAGS